MSSTWGRNYKITIFGESHGVAIGGVIDGVPCGIPIDFSEIEKEMKRRSPGKNSFNTPRSETDTPKVLSGVFEGKTTGSPIAFIIENKDQRSLDYEKVKELARPGHADFTYFIKYKGFNDYRGGGFSSGRLTATLVFSGAIAKQVLESYGIKIGSHIKSIKDICDYDFDCTNISEVVLSELKNSKLPLLNKNIESEMINLIEGAKSQKDSLGGVVECAVIGLKAGVGDPFFDSMESVISGLAFSVPSVKGIEFGLGFDITKLYGSQANDSFYIKNADECGGKENLKNQVVTLTNNNGGINGGISNGMPIVFRVAIKPTPSIGKKQKTINLREIKNEEIELKGRHDPVIVPRIVPVIESVAAIAVLDSVLNGEKLYE